MKYDSLNNLYRKHKLKIPFQICWCDYKEIILTINKIIKDPDEAALHYYLDDNSLDKLKDHGNYESIIEEGFFGFANLPRFKLVKKPDKLPKWF